MFFPSKSNKTEPHGSDEDLNNGVEELDDENNGGPQFCEDGLEPLEMQKLSKFFYIWNSYRLIANISCKSKRNTVHGNLVANILKNIDFCFVPELL